MSKRDDNLAFIILISLALLLSSKAVFSASEGFSDRIANPNSSILDMRDELNEKSALERGDILFGLATTFLLSADDLAKTRVAALGCKMKGWSLPNKKAVKLQQLLLKYSQTEAEKTDLQRQKQHRKGPSKTNFYNQAILFR